MCGINGFNFKDQSLLDSMNRAIAHRGPDGSGVFLDGEISLGHDRLSIIDLSQSAAQPMKSRSGKSVIVFNGEIYNYRELKAELRGSYDFSNQSDTEVILAAYERWGRECVKKFNGIFAFAIWDAGRHELFLARDHAGVKPLYYYADGKRFIFSSEIKALLEHDIPREVNRAAMNFYFRIFYVPEPHTMFAGIKKFPAASYGVVKDGRLTVTKYWEVTDFTDVPNRDEARREVRRLFDDSVAHQLIADRPVGVFLSGGIDSTAVLGAVARIAEARTKTFSVGFDIKGDDEKFNSDFLLARKTAAHYGTDHRELTIGADDLLQQLEGIAWQMDEPNFNPTAGAMLLLSRLAKKEVAVVLGGDGGDELFGGYPRYHASRLISGAQKFPRAVQGLLSMLLARFGKNAWAEKLKLGPAAGRVLAFLGAEHALMSEVLPDEFTDPHPVLAYFNMLLASGDAACADFEKLFMNVDRQSWLRDESLSRTDKMTMSQGLEARVPILDYRLIELAMKIPTAWKFGVLQSSSRFQGKAIWREAIADYLPSHVQNERKRGWFTPMAKWLREGKMRAFAGEVLGEAGKSGFFKPDGIQKVWEDHVSGKRYNLNIIWAIIMWQLWYNRFIKK